jgi:hypothetical protein
MLRSQSGLRSSRAYVDDGYGPSKKRRDRERRAEDLATALSGSTCAGMPVNCGAAESPLRARRLQHTVDGHHPILPLHGPDNWGESVSS